MSIEINKVIGIEYTLKDANTSEQLDSNVGGAPLEFISGKGQIIPGLESRLITMEAGESADVMVTPDQAYGEYNEDAIQTLPKEQFAGIDLVEGMSLYGTGENGETVQVAVKSFNDNEVTIDFNHPMAGRTLMFTVAVLSERAATEEEVQTGVVGGMAAMGGCGCGSEKESHSHGGGSCSTDSEHSHGMGGGCGCSH